MLSKMLRDKSERLARKKGNSANRAPLSLIGTFHRKESYYNEFESKKVLGPFQRFREARRSIKTLRKILKVIFFFWLFGYQMKYLGV